METIVAGEGTLDPIGGRHRPLEQDEVGERILEVSGWMMILGTVRLICAFGAYLGSFLDGLGVAGPSLGALGRYLQDNPPIVVLGSSWPLILGLILRRTRNRGLLVAAAVTFFILSLGGILGIAARLILRTDPTIVFGSFDVSRWGLRHLNPASLAQALLGSIELALELATAAAAWALAHACRGSLERRRAATPIAWPPGCFMFRWPSSCSTSACRSGRLTRRFSTGPASSGSSSCGPIAGLMARTAEPCPPPRGRGERWSWKSG